MRSRMAKQVQELRLRWSQESFWQEGQARGAVRVCKVMGLDQAGTCEYLRALLPELPREDAERLVRYYWRDDICLLYTSPSPRDPKTSRMPSSA